MKPYQVLIISQSQEKQTFLIDEAVYKVRYRTKSSVSISEVEEADIIVGNIPRSLATHAKKLKLLQLESAGSERYVGEGLLPKGCILTNASGSFGLAIAEYLIGTILMQMRNLHTYVRNQDVHIWRSELPISSIYGSTFLIAGMGDLGVEFATRIKALGGYTIGIKKHIDKKLDCLDEQYTMKDLPNLLNRADVVTLCLPSTKETRGCFKKEYYDNMKKNSILVNVGRGDILKLDELLEAVQKEKLAGAILDVYEKEPLLSSHPLWNEKRILMTPHISGTFELQESCNRFSNIVNHNLDAFHKHEGLWNIVDVAQGYRKEKITKRL